MQRREYSPPRQLDHAVVEGGLIIDEYSDGHSPPRQLDHAVVEGGLEESGGGMLTAGGDRVVELRKEVSRSLTERRVQVEYSKSCKYVKFSKSWTALSTVSTVSTVSTASTVSTVSTGSRAGSYRERYA